MEPWEECPNIWATKSKFFTYLRGALRQAIWNRYPVKLEFKNEQCEKPPKGYAGRAKSGKHCALSGVWEGKSKLEVDHIEGNVSLQDWEDLTPFIQHLCLSGKGKNNLQLVTKEAHKIKSYADRHKISFEDARIAKQCIASMKAPTDTQKKFLSRQGYTEEEMSNAAKRKKCYLQYFTND